MNSSREGLFALQDHSAEFIKLSIQDWLWSPASSQDVLIMPSKYPDFVEDVTPAEELEILEMQRNMRWTERDRGTGRPTKKDRRELDDFFEWEFFESFYC